MSVIDGRLEDSITYAMLEKSLLINRRRVLSKHLESIPEKN